MFAPYGDAVIHLSSVWMLSDFTEENGGTLVVPGSHRASNNPTGGNGIDVMSPYPTEQQATGKAGDVLLFDSRTWHAAGANTTDQPRLGLAVRYAPWWFNLDYLMPPDSPEKQRLAEEVGRPVEELSGGEPTLTPEHLRGASRAGQAAAEALGTLAVIRAALREADASILAIRQWVCSSTRCGDLLFGISHTFDYLASVM